MRVCLTSGKLWWLNQMWKSANASLKWLEGRDAPNTLYWHMSYITMETAHIGLSELVCHRKKETKKIINHHDNTVKGEWWTELFAWFWFLPHFAAWAGRWVDKKLYSDLLHIFLILLEMIKYASYLAHKPARIVWFICVFTFIVTTGTRMWIKVMLGYRQSKINNMNTYRLNK